MSASAKQNDTPTNDGHEVKIGHGTQCAFIVRKNYSGYTTRHCLNGGERESTVAEAVAAHHIAQLERELTTTRAEAEALRKALHWPECWDTAAYPTLESAAREVFECNECCYAARGAERWKE